MSAALRSLTAAVLAVAALAAPAASQAAAPAIGAPAAIVIDARTGEVLYARRAHDERSIASTTKLMTAMVTLANTKPSEVFRAPPYAAAAAESKIGLSTGERMTVHDLLRAMMLPSANDAAYDLAVNVGGSKARFVRMMNARARATGLRETHYSTPIGLDDPGNYSSAYDLAKLAALLLRNQTFARVVDLPSARLNSGSHPRTVINRNDLVRRYPFVNGIKTGHTVRAGYVLVGAAGARGAEVVSVVLGEPSIAARNADSIALLRYGVAQFRRVTPVVARRVYARPSIRWHDGDRVDLVASRSVTLTARRGNLVRRQVRAPDQVEGPLPRGSRVGEVRVIYRGRVVRTVPLVTASPVEGAGLLEKAAAGLGGPLPALAFAGLVVATALLGWRVLSTRGMRREREARR